jgi:hypothetical protein
MYIGESEMIKKTLLYLMVIVTIFAFQAAWAQDEYVPDQLILIHGFGPGSPDVWKKMVEELEEKSLFAPSKYFGIDNLYFTTDAKKIPGMSQESIQNYGNFVLNESRNIKSASQSPNPKQRLVAHSMGGLAARWATPSLDIERNIYLGVPHLGSPLASALWLLKEADQAEFHDLINNVYRVSRGGYYTKVDNFNNPFILKLALDDFIHYKIMLRVFLNSIKPLNFDAFGNAVADLRVSEPASYIKEFMYPAGLDSLYSFVLSKGHSENLNLKNLYRTTNNKSLVGTGGFFADVQVFATKNLFNIIGQGRMYFPALNGLDDLGDGKGDGVVSIMSQSLMGNVEIVPATHGEETEKVDEILSMIDDAPVIDRVRLLEAPGYGRSSTYNIFLTFKVKEYFLADLEIESLTLDGADINLAPFKEPESGTFKPYALFGQEFLQKRAFLYGGIELRDYHWVPVDLEAGEFFVKLDNISAGAHRVNVSFKNPAGKSASLSFQFSRPVVSNLFIPPFIIDGKESDCGIVCRRSGLLIDEKNDDRHTAQCLGDTINVSCRVSDPLFKSIGYSIESHVSNYGSYRDERFDQLIQTGTAQSGDTIHGTYFGSLSSHPYGTRDIYVSAIGLNGGAPAVSLSGAQVQDNAQLSLRGTNYDYYQNRYKVALYRCDPSFIQSPPILKGKDISRAECASEMSARIAYFKRLGIDLEEKENVHYAANSNLVHPIIDRLVKGSNTGDFFYSDLCSKVIMSLLKNKNHLFSPLKSRKSVIHNSAVRMV